MARVVSQADGSTHAPRSANARNSPPRYGRQNQAVEVASSIAKKHRSVSGPLL